MQINKLDNVEVNLENGHKYALQDIPVGAKVVKYGNPIGHATKAIRKGEQVHTHNLSTDLSDNLTYTYDPVPCTLPMVAGEETFLGYLRPNGDVGIRNEVWIIPTVGCVNKVAQRVADITGAFAFPHPYGCSQLGDDQALTMQVLKGLVNHPNAAGVLVLGLGCENNNIELFQQILGEYDSQRVKFLNCQDAADEIDEAVQIIRRLQAYAEQFQAVPVPVSVKLPHGSLTVKGLRASPL